MYMVFNSIGNQLINARSETVEEKPAYRTPMKRRWCLVVADSFYEWQKIPGRTRKQPIRIMLKNDVPFGFAGLWDVWQVPDGSEIESYAIITCDPNDLTSMIHNRMPIFFKNIGRF